MHKTGGFIFGNPYFQHGAASHQNSFQTLDSTDGGREVVNHLRWPSIQVGGTPGAAALTASGDPEAGFYNHLLKNAKTPTEREIEKENRMQIPFKFKTRAGRYARGQSDYDPLLDLNNWDRDSKVAATGALSPVAMQKALFNSESKPIYRTKYGRNKMFTREQQLFPELVLEDEMAKHAQESERIMRFLDQMQANDFR
jgi:hypothetical protein